MNILYIAYSCSPNQGSEDKIGWTIPALNAEHHNVYVITKREHEREIERYLKYIQGAKPHFLYVDIPVFYKKLFKGAFYSGRLGIWQKRAYRVAKALSIDAGIEIIHQITPIEFRSMGKYYRIPGIRFVLGPIAGGQRIPKGLMSYCKGYCIIEWIRKCVNFFYQVLFRLTNELSKNDCVLFANAETQMYLLHKIKCRVQHEVYPDVSVEIRPLDLPKQIHKSKRRFIVVGRLVHLKGVNFLMDAFKCLPADLDYECWIVGDGPQMDALMNICKSKSLDDRIVFTGAVAHERISEYYDQADVLIMPSFREATGSVILEAMERGLPVIALNRFGARMIVNDRCGWLYDGNTREEMLDSLTQALTQAISNYDEVVIKSANARQRMDHFTWSKRIEYYNRIYRALASDHKQNN